MHVGSDPDRRSHDQRESPPGPCDPGTSSRWAWILGRGAGPLVATAIHAGHEVRAELRSLMAIDEDTRRREEDPHTDQWLSIASNRIVVLRSRFEVDLNRPREKAIYLSPDDAWGLTVWRKLPDRALHEHLLGVYDSFYREMERWIESLIARHGRVVVFDLHAYCHRRAGPTAAPDDTTTSPEINIGMATIDRAHWGAVVDRFVSGLREFDFEGRPLDVRENVKFQGGHFPRWINERFGQQACAIAVEVKKIFMDEWTGIADRDRIVLLRMALANGAAGVLTDTI